MHSRIIVFPTFTFLASLGDSAILIDGTFFARGQPEQRKEVLEREKFWNASQFHFSRRRWICPGLSTDSFQASTANTHEMTGTSGRGLLLVLALAPALAQADNPVYAQQQEPASLDRVLRLRDGVWEDEGPLWIKELSPKPNRPPLAQAVPLFQQRLDGDINAQYKPPQPPPALYEAPPSLSIVRTHPFDRLFRRQTSRDHHRVASPLNSTLRSLCRNNLLRTPTEHHLRHHKSISILHRARPLNTNLCSWCQETLARIHRFTSRGQMFHQESQTTPRPTA